MTTHVTPVSFTDKGVIIPEETVILAEKLQDYNDAFGGFLNITNYETPQGQLATSDTQAIGRANAFWLWLVNQIDPNTASGVMQDAIGKIYFLTRKPAQPTTVDCTCVGLGGTVIPAGTRAKDEDGNIYYATESATIPVGGSVTVTFANELTGPIPCPANTLNQIYRTIIGWDTINNPSDGTLGRDVESRAEFETRRKNSVAVNSSSQLAAIYSAVFDVTNVSDVYVDENYTGGTVARGATNYPLVEHSFYVAAWGGLDAEIALAIFNKKAPGSNMNGNTTISVEDTIVGHSYNITFNRPDPLPIKFAVSIVDNPLLPADITTLVKNAIIALFDGANGAEPERIGETVYASRFYQTVILIDSSVSLISILIGTSTAINTSVAVGIDQKPIITAGNITVNLV